VTAASATGTGAAAAAPVNRRLRAVLALGAVMALFCVGFVWSVSLGTEPISLHDILVGMTTTSSSASDNVHQLVVHLIRLPRALLAAMVGGTLAVAGVVMQSITRNPLGAPEILGVNAGAAVTVALASTIWPGIASIGLIALSFGGGAAAACLVFGLARFGRGGLSPVRLALAGVTISLLLFALMQGILIVFSQDPSLFFFWLVGGVNYAEWGEVHRATPWMGLGLVLTAFLAARLNVLALGDDVARGLGQNVAVTRFVGVVAVVLLAGAAVGVAGPVAFIGLITPHIVRRLVGQNHFVVLPLSLVLGAALFLYADIGSRYLAEGVETPSGVVTALVGAPLFIYLARREKVAS
jgi:iron complex transport system permease protein